MICTGVMGTKIKIGERKKEEDNDTINNYTKRKLKEKKSMPNPRLEPTTFGLADRRDKPLNHRTNRKLLCSFILYNQVQFINTRFSKNGYKHCKFFHGLFS